MSQSAKAQEPSMEEILASIRRIIADDDAGKPAKPPEPAAPIPAAVAPPPPAPEPAPAPDGRSQDEVDAMLADLEPPKADVPQAEPEPSKADPAPPADVFDLTEAMAAPAPQPTPNFRTIESASDVVFTDPVPQAAERTDDVPRTPDRTLLSSSTAAAVDKAFNSLAHTVLGQNARTLEDLVKEMLRPMLKSWLDDNLPGLVERIVRAEIERVSRGRG